MTLRSTMQEPPLTIASLLRHGAEVYGESCILWPGASGVEARPMAAVYERTRRLAAALQHLGLRPGEVAGTFAWNTVEHLEAYFAVPAMGGVLHTVNIRLAPADLVYMINHAADHVLFVDASLAPRLSEIAAQLTTVRHVIIIGERQAWHAQHPRQSVHAYEDLLAASAPLAAWPEVDERAPAGLCYTSGTTGEPKGVVYSHRSNYLHATSVCTGNALALCESDRVLPLVPMFHANAWGLPYAAWMSGADLLLPGRAPQPGGLAELIATARPSVAAGVPTVFSDLLAWGESHPLDLSSLRVALSGGAAVPLQMMQTLAQRYGVTLWQAWGMTETSPVAAIARPPKQVTGASAQWQWRARAGRLVCGVSARIVGAAGDELPRDGQSVGEIQVRGAWVTASYLARGEGDSVADKFHDGWLRTGDLGTLDSRGFLHITDRQKDVIKSGGEWISSVALEHALMSHPEVREAAVIAVPDQRWQERPLACIVARASNLPQAASLQAHLLSLGLAKWWLPEHWVFVAAIPRTSVGKVDKKLLKAQVSAGEHAVTESAAPSGRIPL